MKLYVIRHGETEQWKNRIIANLSEPLNKKGMNQAINVGKKLRKLDLDIIYCSPPEIPLERGEYFFYVIYSQCLQGFKQLQ